MTQRAGGFKKHDPRTKALGEKGRQANNFLRKFREKKVETVEGSAQRSERVNSERSARKKNSQIDDPVQRRSGA